MKIKTILWLVIFSIAMGYLESAVVIYLRKIYYPNGFQFPLVPLEASIGMVELFREAATILMLLGVGILSAKTSALRMAHFIFCFAIWDLFYYIFLWLFLGWPQSLYTWDILFLIPVPWVGPVITPCIISLTMMLLASSIIYFQGLGWNTKLSVKEWGLFSTGSFVVILSFVWDYWNYIRKVNLSGINNPLSGQRDMFSDITAYIPVDFNWPLFLAGESILLYGIAILIVRLRSENMNTRSIPFIDWKQNPG